MFIQNPKELLDYGLPMLAGPMPHSYSVMRSFGLLEVSVARHYWLQHELLVVDEWKHKRDVLLADYEAHLWALSHFLVDYTLTICAGEARHCHNNDINNPIRFCPRCSVYPAATDMMLNARLNCAKTALERFKTYDEAFLHMVHTFNDHKWSSGIGGWHWGNIAWIGYRLYMAMTNHNLAQVAIELDTMLSLSHNNGSMFIGKFEAVYTSLPLLNMILWAKQHGHPCCYKFLHAAGDITNFQLVDFRSDYYPKLVGCAHASNENHNYIEKPLYPWMAGPFLCGFCNRKVIRQQNFDFELRRCKEYCALCRKCGPCKAVDAPCTYCGKLVLKHKICEDYCSVCKNCYVKPEDHPKCHHCGYRYIANYCCSRAIYRFKVVNKATSISTAEYNTLQALINSGKYAQTPPPTPIAPIPLKEEDNVISLEELLNEPNDEPEEPELEPEESDENF